MRSSRGRGQVARLYYNSTVVMWDSRLGSAGNHAPRLGKYRRNDRINSGAIEQAVMHNAPQPLQEGPVVLPTGAAGQRKRYPGPLVYTARVKCGGTSPPRAAQSLGRWFFAGASGVLRGPAARASAAEVVGQTTALALQAFPKLPPAAPSFPASAAGVDRLPVAQLPRQLPLQ
jgi:hypothetical protein